MPGPLRLQASRVPIRPGTILSHVVSFLPNVLIVYVHVTPPDTRRLTPPDRGQVDFGGAADDKIRSAESLLAAALKSTVIWPSIDWVSKSRSRSDPFSLPRDLAGVRDNRRARCRKDHR